MNNTVLYIVVFVSLAHFVAAIVFLFYKLRPPGKGKPSEGNDTQLEKPDKP